MPTHASAMLHHRNNGHANKMLQNVGSAMHVPPSHNRHGIPIAKPLVHNMMRSHRMNGSQQPPFMITPDTPHDTIDNQGRGNPSYHRQREIPHREHVPFHRHDNYGPPNSNPHFYECNEEPHYQQRPPSYRPRPNEHHVYNQHPSRRISNEERAYDPQQMSVHPPSHHPYDMPNRSASPSRGGIIPPFRQGSTHTDETARAHAHAHSEASPTILPKPSISEQQVTTIKESTEVVEEQQPKEVNTDEQGNNSSSVSDPNLLEGSKTEPPLDIDAKATGTDSVEKNETVLANKESDESKTCSPLSTTESSSLDTTEKSKNNNSQDSNKTMFNDALLLAEVAAMARTETDTNNADEEKLKKDTKEKETDSASSVSRGSSKEGEDAREAAKSPLVPDDNSALVIISPNPTSSGSFKQSSRANEPSKILDDDEKQTKIESNTTSPGDKSLTQDHLHPISNTSSHDQCDISTVTKSTVGDHPSNYNQVLYEERQVPLSKSDREPQMVQVDRLPPYRRDNMHYDERPVNARVPLPHLPPLGSNRSFEHENYGRPVPTLNQRPTNYAFDGRSRSISYVENGRSHTPPPYSERYERDQWSRRYAIEQYENDQDHRHYYHPKESVGYASHQSPGRVQIQYMRRQQHPDSMGPRPVDDYEADQYTYHGRDSDDRSLHSQNSFSTMSGPPPNRREYYDSHPPTHMERNHPHEYYQSPGRPINGHYQSGEHPRYRGPPAERCSDEIDHANKIRRQFETPGTPGKSNDRQFQGRSPSIGSYGDQQSYAYQCDMHGALPMKDSSGIKKTILRRKCAWKNYPELEAFLIANRDEYLRHSAMNYTVQQKQYNNRLTERLLEVAAKHNYVFDENDFNFVAVRDRIRCYYKSYVQSSKKRGIIVGYSAQAQKKRKVAAETEKENASENESNNDESNIEKEGIKEEVKEKPNKDGKVKEEDSKDNGEKVESEAKGDDTASSTPPTLEEESV